ncbi:class I adenylate-forming enzyme family protein [Knoellia remsis]|uniref:class I adenylate-forming enzyme family protein n=1 Tax=Knoellia remsis TaxID=407159 RepID=UPI001472CA3F|nr:fatty acid--CoA ligase family protein [Knoellia remsis]
MRPSPSRLLLRELGILVGSGPTAHLELSTSGTTGTPRTVRRTLASWERSYEHVTALTGITGEDRVLVPSPPRSSLFAFALAHSAHVGAPTVPLERWSARLAAEAAATCTAAHLTPPMLSALLDRDLGALRTVVCAGGSLPRSTRQRATERGVTVVDYYGATELSFVAMRQDGRMSPFPEVEVELRQGAIWVRSPWVAQDYAVGEGPMTRDRVGWTTVGDRGRWSDDDGLVVLGRGDDAVTTGGATVLCGDVEVELLDLPAVRQAVVVGTPHPQLGAALEAVVVAAPGTDPRQLRSELSTRVAPTHLPRRWHLWDELPLTSRGVKVDRSAVRERLVAERHRGAAS